MHVTYISIFLRNKRILMKNKKSPHPKWALKFKTKGTELRCFNNRYYLYKITSKWDKIKKKTRKITLEMIGRINEKNGLIPKGTKRLSIIKKIKRPLYSKEYGASKFLQDISKDIIDNN